MSPQAIGTLSGSAFDGSGKLRKTGLAFCKTLPTESLLLGLGLHY